ncbi:CBS domain-containing protein, partial [Nocardioides sp.]|uniref:CBS domain-containing protein n=1 Tax=Nocardioides sp. TaxID=35761 RepID=UPI00286E6238
IELLGKHEFSAMPVTDSAGHLVGVVSEADVIREMVVPDQRSHEIPVRLTAAPFHAEVADVMSTHALTVTGDTDLAVAAELLTSSAVKSLPVVDHGRLVGVVSRRDIIEVLARPDVQIESEIDELFRQAGYDWLVDVIDGVAVIDGPEVESEQELAVALATAVPGVVGIRFRST